MIKELHISNIAIIDDSEMEFESDYVALIGETGAGKSLIVNSLSFLSGDKVDYSLLRDNKKKAFISATFKLDESFINAHLELKEYLNEENILTLKRVLNPDHTSKLSLNDEPVSLSTYKEVTSHLIDIHSQGAKSEILNEEKQIDYVDKYGGESLKKAKDEFSLAYSNYVQALNQLKALKEENKDLDRDYLEFQIAEIEKYQLKENEIEDLNNEFDSLKDYDQLKKKYDDYKVATSTSDGDLNDLISSLLMKIRNFKDTPLSEEAQKLSISANDILDALNSFEDKFKNLKADPRRIDYINERLYELKTLQRKFGKTTDEILNKYNEFKEKLDLIDNFESKIEIANKKISELFKIVEEKANILSLEREKSSLKMSKEIGKEMADLGLRKDSFRVNLTKCEINALGGEKCAFEVALNEGLEYAKLSKAASGGESSRLMLALKVVLNALDPYNLLVFDEIDTGVSGKSAYLIAKKIKSISHHSQVVVISHLPQVIAASNSNIFISKSVKAGMTYSQAKALSEKELIEFVAVMLSGDKLTDSALKQAQELLNEF